MPGYEIIDKKEEREIKKIFSSGKVFFAHGFEKQRKGIYRVRNFEKKFSNKIKTKYSLAVSSGTAALKIALKSLNIRAGDEVITQPFNFIATVEAIIDCGAKPVFTKIDASLNMDMEDLKKKINFNIKPSIVIHCAVTHEFKKNKSIKDYIDSNVISLMNLINFSKAFKKINPDLILVTGDRYEILCAAIVANILRIRLAHIHGGETTLGSYDNGSRNAITKLSFIHFVSTSKYKAKVIQMGESPKKVFNVGSLSVENLIKINIFVNTLGVYFIYLYYPSTPLLLL